MADTPKTMSGRIRSAVKPYADQVGIGDFLRQSWVESHRLGEYIRRTAGWRPAPQDAVLLTGSGRSGTTWLSNVLTALPGMQLIYEPLFPLWNAEARRLTGWEVSAKDFRGVYLRAQDQDEAWHRLLERILRGEIRNYWTDYDWTSWFPRRFLIKEIRANLMLGFIYDHFQPRILYLMRHPCAVIQSRLTASWHADVQDILKQEELVEDYLRPWIQDIERETDLVGAHAILWAVENMVALHDLATREHLRIYYEMTVIEPIRTVQEVANWLDEHDFSRRYIAELAKRESRTSPGNDYYSLPQDRLAHWRKKLPADDQRRIIAWAHRLGIKDYDFDPLPRQQD